MMDLIKYQGRGEANMLNLTLCHHFCLLGQKRDLAPQMPEFLSGTLDNQMHGETPSGQVWPVLV